MKIFDLYIIKKLLTTFFFSVLIAVVVVCVIDYTEKSDDFIRHDLPFSQIISEYYVTFVPFMMSTLSPILVFISVVFITARMASHTEIVAMFASGMSFRRILLPYLIGAVFLGSLIFWLVGWVIPNAAKTKVEFQIKYLHSPYYFDSRDVHFKVNDSTYFYLQSYNNKSQVGYRCTIEKISDGKLVEKLSANRIQWNQQKEKWSLASYKIYTFKDGKETFNIGGTMDTTLNIYPRHFESTRYLNETMTLKELDQYIEEQADRGIGNVAVYQNEKYERYAYPFAIIVLTVMGVIVAARKSRQGSGVQIAFGFFLAFVFILFVVMSRSVGRAGSIEPMLAAWLPNITFSIIAAIMYFTVPR